MIRRAENGEHECVLAPFAQITAGWFWPSGADRFSHRNDAARLGRQILLDRHAPVWVRVEGEMGDPEATLVKHPFEHTPVQSIAWW